MISIVYFCVAKKSALSCEYMDDWEKVNEMWLSEKEDFYSHLNMEDITDVDYTHSKKAFKDFEIKV